MRMKKRFLLLILFFSLGADDFHHQEQWIDRGRPFRPHTNPPPSEMMRPGVAPQPAVPPDENSPPELSPEVYPQDKMPPIELPNQGTVPKIHKPKPLELQDQGNLMSHPMPQRNPGPSSFNPVRPLQKPPQRFKDR
jgi:hypothetical protein